MSDFLKSALGFIQPHQSKEEHGFVGQHVEIGDQRLKVKKLIAEGGFAFVFVAEDVSSRKDYALKRLLASEDDKNAAIIKEIKFAKKLSGHANIVEFISAASIGGKNDPDHRQAEYLLLSELCVGGVVDLYNARGSPLPLNKVLPLFYQACSATQHMHLQKPAIIHRDLKLENLLLTRMGVLKLCDFGSATTDAYYPDDTWTHLQRGTTEDEITKNTTPMYRAPEVLDLYQNNAIAQPQDVWALGCVLYMLCYGVHPYEDSAKLRILNANYTIPEDDRVYKAFHKTIRDIFKIDPWERPDIKALVKQMEQLAQTLSVNPTEPLPPEDMDLLTGGRDPPGSVNSNHSSNSSSAPHPSHQPSSQTAPAARGGLFTSLKGGAGSLMRNIKDASSKVAHSVQQTVTNTIGKTELDLAFITSRVAVMPFPADGMEMGPHNSYQEVYSYLERRFHGTYHVYNLSHRTYDPKKFEGRVTQLQCETKAKVAPLNLLFTLCRQMEQWLEQDSSNVCIIHDEDGASVSGTAVGCLLAYCKFSTNSQAILSMLLDKRCLSSMTTRNFDVVASQNRYVSYMNRLSRSQVPHRRAIQVTGVTMNPVPVFNKQRTGCRPLIELKVGRQTVLSTSQDYERMREWTVSDGQIHVPLKPTVCIDDVTMCVSHARSSLGTKIQGKLQNIRMFQVQFHTGYIEPGTSKVSFKKCDLDLGAAVECESLVDLFTVTLDVKISNQERQSGPSPPWEGWSADSVKPSTPFSSSDEYNHGSAKYAQKQRGPSRPPPPPPPPSNTTESGPATTTVGRSSFYVGVDHPSAGGEHMESLVNQSESDSDSEEGITPNNGPTFEPLVNSADLLNISGASSSDGSNGPVPARAQPGQAAASATVNPSRGNNAFDLLGLGDVSSSTSASREGGSSAELSQQAAPVPDLFADFQSLGTSGAADSAAQSDWMTQSAGPPMGNGTSLTSSQPAFGLLNSNASSQNSVAEPNLLDGFLGGVNVGSQQGISAPQTGSQSNSGDLLGSWTQATLPVPGQGVGGGAGMVRNSSGATFGIASQKPPSQPSVGNLRGIPRNYSAPNIGSPPATPETKGSLFGDIDDFLNAPNVGEQAAQTGASAEPSSQPQPVGVSGEKASNQQSKPNYFVGGARGGANVFGGSSTGYTGVGPKMEANAFNDLLSDHNFTGGAGSKEPRTIKEMRKEQLSETVDPDVLKVREWTEGKEGNIRALLCSLHSVLWDEESRWSSPGMHELVTAGQVKKWFRKSILCVHPDKLVDSPFEELANLVMIELNKAWNDFESRGMQSL